MGEREKNLIFLFFLLLHSIDSTGFGEVEGIFSWGQGKLEK
jgi:hypothetical protein